MAKSKVIKTPTITFEGQEEIRPSRFPKTGLWRKLTKLTREQQDVTGMPTEELLDSMEELIILAFADERVTHEALKDDLDLGEFMPLFYSVSVWVNKLAAGKMTEIAKIPNE